MGEILVPAFAAAMFLGAILFRGRRTVFWFAFLLPFVPIEYIDRYHWRLPTLLKWSPLVGMVAAALLALMLLPTVRTRVPRPARWGIGLLLGFALLSMLVNGTALAAYVAAQRGWILTGAAIIALKMGYGIYDREHLHRVLVRLGLISSVASLVQRLVVVPTVAGPDAADRVTGLFSVGYQQLFYHLFCFGIVLSYDLRGRRLLSMPSWLTLLILLGSLAVGNEKASLPYLFLLGLFLVWRTGFRAVASRAGKPLLAAVVMPALLLVGYSAVNYGGGGEEDSASYTEQLSDLDYLRRYLFGDENTRLTSGGELRRGAAVLFVWDEIADEPHQIAFGLGPGETADSRLPGASGGLAARHPDKNITRISLAMVLGDTGLLGLLLYGVALASIWFSRAAGDPPEHDRVREMLVFLAVAYSPYANMTNEAIYCLLIAVVLYPWRKAT